MPERANVPWNNSHPGSNPSLVFVLCLLAGPLGLLYLGIAETFLVGVVFLTGVSFSYWIWPSMLPEFIGFSLVLLAFTARRRTIAPESTSIRSEVLKPFARAWPMAVTLATDLGMLCLGAAVLEQLWMELGRTHILGVILSVCITLPSGLVLAHLIRENIIRRLDK